MTTDTPLGSALAELLRDGVLERTGGRYTTSQRWRAVRHQASSAAHPPSEVNEPDNPIVKALLAFYGGRRSADSLGTHVAVLFAFESARRAPRPRHGDGSR